MGIKFKYGSYGDIALQNLNEAKGSFNAGLYKGTGFWSQQAVELILKEYINTKESNPSNELLHSHSISKFTRAYKELSHLKSISGFSDLANIYFNTRYPGDEYWVLDRESAEEVLGFAIKVVDEICVMIESIRNEKDRGCANDLHKLQLD